ncbi:unnamed protein product [[Actinomadura] parvosata subsp. kistnae]|uniref:hypothetical protein n=1 Tax=[Actinomadura] parvosata TaxID=1955412 RepID=UPI000D2DFF94|nr:hypothetical protein [Nonomuraea sp. ATCC 55076]SPL88735.1 unnamed protein product [Actinomadura parvosata subsp. kistnae]
MAGPVTRYPVGQPGAFSMYWLSEPAFDAVAVAARIQRIHQAMCDFFREPAPGHRLFIRKHPYRCDGGTAAPVNASPAGPVQSGPVLPRRPRRAELGESAREDSEATMEAGACVVPAPEAFGAGFTCSRCGVASGRSR